MNLKAIVFTSNTGHAAAYAKLLSDAAGIPAIPLSEAKTKLPGGSDILYLGWLCAGSVQGLKPAEQRFRIRAVCAVGMGPEDEKQTAELCKRYASEERPLFYLQGGFEMDKLKGVYLFMMRFMAKTAGKSLAQKENRTAAEDDMLELMQHGGSRVDSAQLMSVLHWIAAQE